MDRREAVARAHAGHHAETSAHRPPDERVDDTVSGRMLGPHLLRAGLFLLLPTLLLLVSLVLDYLAAMSSPSATADTVRSLLGLLVAGLYLAGIAAALVPAKEPVAEWSRLVEGAGDAAAAVAVDLRAAAARRSPARVVPERVGGVEVLVLSQRRERAVLLVQPYGTDLYVGWTLWRARSSVTLLGHFLRDTFVRGPGGPSTSSELRAAATRAFRESVHSLAREAAAAAAAGPGSEPPGPHPAGAPVLPRAGAVDGDEGREPDADALPPARATATDRGTPAREPVSPPAERPVSPPRAR